MIDIRNLGLIGGIELEPRPGAPTQRALDVNRACFDAGLLVRVTGDIIALSPPLIVEKAQIDQMVDTIRTALESGSPRQARSWPHPSAGCGSSISRSAGPTPRDA